MASGVSVDDGMTATDEAERNLEWIDDCSDVVEEVNRISRDFYVTFDAE